jgi:hypothetical protein
MPIVPNVQAKPMSDLKPGELVRFRFRGLMPLALAVGCDFLQIPSGMVLILLEGVSGDLHPGLQPATRLEFLPLGSDDLGATALSYGDGHSVVVEPSARVVTAFDTAFQTNGALVVGKGLQALRTHARMQNWSHIEIMVDVNTWTAVQGTSGVSGKVAILDWQLRLPGNDRLDLKSVSVFNFQG